MRIMAVDLSVTCTGIAFPDGDTMAVKGRGTGDERRFQLTEHVEIAARACKADLVMIEGLGGVYKGEAAREIPMLHGAVRLALRRSFIPFMRDVSPKTLKKFATGSGNADKDAMKAAAVRLLGKRYATSDECDADWLRIAGLTAYGLPVPVESGRAVLPVPGPQQRVLFITSEGVRIKWPEVVADGVRHLPRVPAA